MIQIRGTYNERHLQILQSLSLKIRFQKVYKLLKVEQPNLGNNQLCQILEFMSQKVVEYLMRFISIGIKYAG